MWALALLDEIRHDFGCREWGPLAICGYEGKYPLDYTAVKTPKCEICLSLWPTYGKKKENKNVENS